MCCRGSGTPSALVRRRPSALSTHR
jgi:hypothetical protein